MKKNLFLAMMLIGLSTTAYQAQTQKGVGINTTTPATTLDVTATTTDNTIADAVLVPRLTATELNNKNGAFSTSQNGALVFVTAGTGTASTKTELVTGKGFYYFDAAAASNVGRWTPVGGGGGASGPDINIYEGDGTLTGDRIVTQNNKNLTFTTGTGQHIVNGTTSTQGAIIRKVTTIYGAYSVLDNDNVIISDSPTANTTITFPATSIAGREVCIFQRAGGDINFSTNVRGQVIAFGQNAGACFLSDGTLWLQTSGY